MVFRMSADGKRELNVHLVAASSSADAEQIIRSGADQTHFFGEDQRTFLQTQAVLDAHGSPLRLYSTRWSNDDNITQIAVKPRRSGRGYKARLLEN